MRVIIIDDHALFRDGLKGLLEQRNIDVAGVAADGQEGIELARKIKPDIILLDLRMPKLDGYRVLEQLRSDAATRSIPVVVITATTPDQESKQKRSMELGATRFISKPINLDSLVMEVKQLVG